MLFMSGCAWIAFHPVESPADPKPPASSKPAYLSEYKDKWCYRQLNPRLQKAYAALYETVREYEQDMTIAISDGKGGRTDHIGLRVELPEALCGRAETQLLYNAFTTDNPAFFYVGNTYSYEGYEQDGQEYYHVFCLVLTMTAAERTVAQKQLDAVVNDWLAALPKDASAIDTELYFHDRLAARCSYDKTVAESKNPSETHAQAFTAYGALVNGRAVCEGYSRAMQLLMHRAGMECTLVSGFGEGASHMWNMVTVDGRSYHVDVTWDDADDLLRHTFFNLTTADIQLTHEIDSENIGLITCTAESGNYYTYKGTYLNTFDPLVIGLAIAEQMRDGATAVDLRFPQDKFDNARLLFSNSRRLRSYVNEHFQEGEPLLKKYTYQLNTVYRTITLYPETDQ